jgi:hypothetical protein
MQVIPTAQENIREDFNSIAEELRQRTSLSPSRINEIAGMLSGKFEGDFVRRYPDGTIQEPLYAFDDEEAMRLMEEAIAEYEAKGQPVSIFNV